MPKVSKECLDEALKGLSLFTRDELSDYAVQVFNRARSYEDVTGIRAIDRATKEINDEHLHSFFQDATIKANNTTKFNRLASKIRESKATLREILIRRYRNKADNVESAQRAARARLDSKLYASLSDEEMAFLIDKNNQYEIARGVDGKEVSPMARKIADNIKEYMEYRNSETVISNALPFDHVSGDRWLRQIHDRSKLISGGISLVKATLDKTKRYTTDQAKNLWRNFIKQHLDIEKTFADTKAMGLDGKIDKAQVDSILDRIFDNIVEDHTNIFTRSGVINDREAVARKARMFFHFKDFESMLKYNEQYGKGDLFHALNADVHGSGNKIGMAELFGDSPYNAYLDLSKTEKETNERSALWMRNTEIYFKQVMGADQTAVSANLAGFFSNLRSVTSMVRLVKITAQSLSDIGYIAAFSQRWGINYLRAYTEHLGHLFNAFPTEERLYIAKLFKTNVDSHLGYIGRFVEANNTSQILNKVSTGFFRGIGLEAFDKGNKISTMHLMAQHLGNMSNRNFSELPDELKKQLTKFDINEKEWDVLRKKNQKGLFTIDNVNNLTNDEIKKLHDESNKSVSLYEMQNTLFRKVYSMFDVASENGVLSPSAFTKAWCLQGTAPGTYMGEFLRSVMQFKMYTLNYVDRALVEGWKDADSAQAKLAWGIQMMLGTIPLAALGTTLDYWSRGQSSPDPTKMNLHDKEEYLFNLIAPSLGIMSGVLDPNNQNSSILWSILGSPSTKFLGNSIASPLALISGNPKKSAKLFSDAMNYILPIQTTPFISPIVRSVLGEQAHLQPGQQQYYGS